jgi:hypothetical protein
MLVGGAMFEPTLVAKWRPFPQVKVTFESLSASTATVTVWRQADVLAIVPGTERVFASGGFTVDDLWAPRDIEVTYWAEMFTAGGVSLGRTGTASTTIWGERNVAVISDPFDPANAALVEMDTGFGSSLRRSREVETYNVGSRVVSLLGEMTLLRDIDLSVKSDTAEQAVALERVLSQSLVLIRLAPDVRPTFPTVLYATVQYEVVDADHLGGFQFGGSAATWVVEGVQVSPITSGAAVSTTPWSRYEAAFVTWAEMEATYETWLDAKQNAPGV